MSATTIEKEIFLTEPESLAKQSSDLQREDIHEEGVVWYLAYGSNMSSAVLTKRRGVKPIKSIPVECRSLYLSFELRSSFPYVEPAFGCILDVMNRDPETLEEVNYIRRRTGNRPIYSSVDISKEELKELLPPTLHGVLHKITKEDYETIRRTEGGGGYDEFGYHDKPVECITYDGKRINALTLEVKRTACYPNCQASLRYLKILRNGAREHNLAPHYQKYLESLEPYKSNSLWTSLGKYFLVVLLSPFIIFIITVMGGSRLLGYKQRLPWAFHWFMEKFSKGIFWFHDKIYSKIFGDGYNTMKHHKSNRVHPNNKL